jgi:hypothetical protein
MKYKEFNSVLEAHVALAEMPEVGTVYRIWDDGSSIYAVDQIRLHLTESN